MFEGRKCEFCGTNCYHDSGMWVKIKKPLPEEIYKKWLISTSFYKGLTMLQTEDSCAYLFYLFPVCITEHEKFLS